jgi:hypothetical protein
VALSLLRIEILRISKYKKRDIDSLRNGIRIDRDCGKQIDDLVMDALSQAHFGEVFPEFSETIPQN